MILFVICPIIVFILTCFMVKDNRKLAESKKKTVKKYFPLTLTIWVASLLFYYFFYSTSMTEEWAVRLNFISYFIFTVCNAAFLLHIRLLIGSHILFAALVFPTTFFFFLNVLVFNKPTYNGAMDGFAAIATFYIMLWILVTFPLFFFAYSMVKCRSWLKGVIMLFVAAITGILGVMQSVGYEGYLADGDGGSFVFIILFTTFVGVYYLVKDERIKKRIVNTLIKPAV